MRKVAWAMVAVGFLSTGCAIPNSMVQDVSGLPRATADETAAALKFEPDAHYARVYIRKPIDDIYLDIEAAGEQLGAIFKEEFIHLSLAPGRYPLRTTTTFFDGDTHLNALFDLEVSAGAIVLLECYSEMTSGILVKVPEDAVLQSWEACSSSELTTLGGVTACIKPYLETNPFKIDGFAKTVPNSACYLSEDRGRFAETVLVKAKRDFITNEAFEFTRAQNANTRESYERFIRAYPQSARRADAQAAINRIEKREAAEQFEHAVTALLARDTKLPLETRKDKYILALVDKLKGKDHRGALVYFEALDRLWIELDPTFRFLWGVTLLEAGERKDGLRHLNSYLGQAGSTGEYYGSALKLINEAEGS